MNILLLGSGGREHAFAWKIAQSKLLGHLFIAPGNAGTEEFGTNIPTSVTDFEGIKKIVLEKNISMVVVGPEDPLVMGIVDFFRQDPWLQRIPVIGPDKIGAQLEGSKDFSKKFMSTYGIPTARYKSFTKEQLKDAKDFLRTLAPPYVIKADGLAAGKGVVIPEDLESADKELTEMLADAKFGAASSKVVIEEFLKGIELSLFVLSDGNSYCLLPAAKDYKRIGEGDTGLNTGGMGAVSPVPFATPEFMEKVEKRIVVPTIEGLKKEKIQYKGFIFVGLINVGGDPYVIEYNCRMGDPETEVVLPRLKNDLLEVFIAIAEGTLSTLKIEIDERVATTVMLVSGGYPGDYEKGKTMKNLSGISGSILFHAGTKKNKEEVQTNGGRVLAITSYGNSLQEALHQSLKNAAIVDFDKKYYRKDIGKDLM